MKAKEREGEKRVKDRTREMGAEDSLEDNGYTEETRERDEHEHREK